MKSNLLLLSCSLLILGAMSTKVEAKPPEIVREARFLVQNAQTTTVITGVKLNPTSTGLQVILETSNQELLQPLIFPEAETLVIEILGAILELPEEFVAENPTPEISKVTIEQIDTASIQIRVTGKTEVPGAEVVPSSENLVLMVTPSLETVEAETEIEITATGERRENNYQVPDATTATGTETPIIDIPQSIQVVPQRLIRDRNTRELQPALQTVPGVSPSSGRGTSIFGPGIIIRGFQANESIYRDGIPFFSLAPISTDDIDRIEVLKGPASVLFGEGEPGGTINLISKQPLEEPFYEFSFTAGNFDTYLTNIDVSTPLNDAKTVKYRLIVSYDTYGSFRDLVEGEMFMISPNLTWEITEKTEVNFYAQYLNSNETIDEGIPALGTGVVDVPRERFLGEEFGELDQEQFTIGYNFKHDFSDNWTIRHAFQYLRYDPTRYAPLSDSFNENTGDLDRLEYYADGRYQRFFVNADVIGNFQTGPILHQLVAGVEYRRNTEDPSFQFDNLHDPINVFDPVYSQRPYAINPTFFRDDEIDRVGVYVQDQMDLLPNLKLLAGIRYDYVDQLRTTRSQGEAKQEFNQSDDRFSPRVGLVYQPIPKVAIYGSYSTSFNPSFGASRNPDDTTFDPETGRQFEVGVKADVTEQFSVTVAAFDIRKKNIQVPDADDPLFTRQSGEQTSRGVELYLNGEIIPGWNLVAGYTYLDAYVNKDITEIEGNTLANVPTNQFGLWTTYEIQKGNLEGLGFGLGLFFVGEREGDIENTFTLPSYFRTDAAVFYNREQWSLQLNVENLFDVEYFAAADSRVRVDPGAPFTIKGEFSFRF